jgi:septum formation inhibitor MinC
MGRRDLQEGTETQETTDDLLPTQNRESSFHHNVHARPMLDPEVHKVPKAHLVVPDSLETTEFPETMVPLAAQVQRVHPAHQDVVVLLDSEETQAASETKVATPGNQETQVPPETQAGPEAQERTVSTEPQVPQVSPAIWADVATTAVPETPDNPANPDNLVHLALAHIAQLHVWLLVINHHGGACRS